MRVQLDKLLFLTNLELLTKPLNRSVVDTLLKSITFKIGKFVVYGREISRATNSKDSDFMHKLF